MPIICYCFYDDSFSFFVSFLNKNLDCKRRCQVLWLSATFSFFVSFSACTCQTIKAIVMFVLKLMMRESSENSFR